jgi:hypothetical protein
LYQLHTLSFFLSPSIWIYIVRILSQFQYSKPRELDPSRSLRFFYSMVLLFNLPSLWKHSTRGEVGGRAIILDFIGMCKSSLTDFFASIHHFGDLQQLTYLQDPNYSSSIYSLYFYSCYSRPLHMKLRCITPVKNLTPKTFFYLKCRDHSRFHSSSPGSGLQSNQNHQPHYQCNSQKYSSRNRSLLTSASIP